MDQQLLAASAEVPLSQKKQPPIVDVWPIIAGELPQRDDAGGSPAAQQPKPYRELLGLTWQLILVMMVLGVHKEVDVQIITPFLYSRIECCGGEPGPPWDPAVQRPHEAPLPAAWDYGDHIVWLNVTADSCNCDLKASYPTAVVVNGSIAPCAVPWLARDDPLWSHSGRCRNYQYVQTEGNSNNNWLSLWQAVGALCLLPTCGRLADLYGRRPVFIWTTVLPFVSFLICTVDAALGLGNSPIYFGGALLTVFLTHGPIGWSMTVDLIPDPVDQARFFPIMSAIQTGSLSSISGDLLGYFVLALHLEDYTFLWGVLTAIAFAILVFMWVMMPETMEDTKEWSGISTFVVDVLPNGAETCAGSPCGETKQKGPRAVEGLETTTSDSGSRSSDSGSSGGGLAVTGAGGSEKPPGYVHAFTLWFRIPHGTTMGMPSSAQMARLRVPPPGNVLQVSMFLCLVSSIVGGASMAYDKTFFLGPLHFLQESTISIHIFGKVATVLSVPLAAYALPRLGPWRAMVFGGVMAVLANPIKVLPWCGAQCQAGPYVSIFVANIGQAVQTPASIMYLAAALKSADLTQAQSALLVVQQVVKNASPMVWSALFFGDRGMMTTGYLVASAVGVAGVVATVVFLPRELPGEAAGRVKGRGGPRAGPLLAVPE